MKFKAFCQSYRIQLKLSSVAHPQANGLAEVTNRAILKGLKKRIFGTTTSWVEELPSILWASQTTPKTPTGESPYSLAFGTEAVLPPKVVFPTLRVQTHGEEASNQQLRENLDLLEEKHTDAHLRTLAYRRAVTRLYNRRMKLAPNYEGPYRIVVVVRDETYTLATIEGRVMSRTWHISNLQKFYTMCKNAFRVVLMKRQVQKMSGTK
ncbi:hypothetical protein B296_00041504 [Ensete ventricosum]|uniref:Integrase catalytic domain-containing protein n=1 Tax=Ensete ventricosum TaxID=4639 RepID=A0A426X4C8_ENSVE|nr:hypothetical protein B296_00041504 [Ensete ventricosum]